MVVNFEFLSGEPMEDLITCMNFKVDKVVFFGYQNVIEKMQAGTEKFLEKACKVQTVVFYSLPQYDLQSILNILRKAVRAELDKKNQIYFDVTGGESLILVAFGMLSKEFETPMHLYDIPGDRLIELDEGARASISKDVAAQKLPMSLELLVEMHGGKINKKLQKELKGMDDPEFMEDVEKIYRIATKNWTCWNPFSQLLRTTLAPEDTDPLEVSKTARTVVNALAGSNTKLNCVRELNKITDALAAAGVLTDLVHQDGHYGFRYKNQEIKDCLWEGGSVLELHTCQKEAGHSDECRVGLHLDWDGEIHSQPGEDVLNEIDVLTLKGYVPTFFSCKSGRMGSQQSLHALYELETVARRFGGKYARKVLVTVEALQPVYQERAAEMGIEVRNLHVL